MCDHQFLCVKLRSDPSLTSQNEWPESFFKTFSPTEDFVPYKADRKFTNTDILWILWKDNKDIKTFCKKVSEVL